MGGVDEDPQIGFFGNGGQFPVWPPTPTTSGQAIGVVEVTPIGLQHIGVGIGPLHPHAGHMIGGVEVVEEETGHAFGGQAIDELGPAKQGRPIHVVEPNVGEIGIGLMTGGFPPEHP